MKMAWQENCQPDANILKCIVCFSIPKEDKGLFTLLIPYLFVFFCIDGCRVMNFGDETLKFYRGDCFFIPASYPVVLRGEAQFLDVWG